jgi:Lon protease-like protein
VAFRPVNDFPLFLLPIVLLPSEVVPLHIFEDRYKAMIARCLEDHSEFGIVWLADDGLKEIGCTAQIAEVLERAPDGRMNILVRGKNPFKLLERQENLLYPAGTVELLDDGPGKVEAEAGPSRASLGGGASEDARDALQGGNRATRARPKDRRPRSHERPRQSSVSTCRTDRRPRTK